MEVSLLSNQRNVEPTVEHTTEGEFNPIRGSVQEAVEALLEHVTTIPTYEERCTFMQKYAPLVFAQVRNEAYNTINWNNVSLEGIRIFCFEGQCRILGRNDTTHKIITAIMECLTPTPEARRIFELVDDYRNFNLLERLMNRRRFKSRVVRYYVTRFRPLGLHRGGRDRTTGAFLLSNILNQVSEHMKEYASDPNYRVHLAWKFIYAHNAVLQSGGNIREFLYEPDANGVSAMDHLLSSEIEPIFQDTNIHPVQVAIACISNHSQEFKAKYPLPAFYP